VADHHAVRRALVLFWGGLVPIALAAYSVGRHATRRRALLGAVIIAVALVVLDLRVPELQKPGEIVFHWLVLSVAWGLGWVVGQRDRSAIDSQRRAETAEQVSEARALAAVMEERSRIARELHDVVAHAVSVMVVQAGAAEQLVDDDPQRARAMLAVIRSTGSEALAEMRRLVGILRHTDDGLAMEPNQGSRRCPRWPSACAVPGSRSPSTSKATRGRCLPASTWRRTASFRRP